MGLCLSLPSSSIPYPFPRGKEEHNSDLEVSVHGGENDVPVTTIVSYEPDEKDVPLPEEVSNPSKEVELLSTIIIETSSISSNIALHGESDSE